jgi:hypothetical protein
LNSESIGQQRFYKRRQREPRKQPSRLAVLLNSFLKKRPNLKKILNGRDKLKNVY